MSTYKIINISNLVGTREPSYNTTVDIDYVEEMSVINTKLKPGEVMYMNIPTLPMSVHKLRTKGLVDVIEINSKEASLAAKPKISPPVVKKEDDEKKYQQHTQRKKEKKTD